MLNNTLSGFRNVIEEFNFNSYHITGKMNFIPDNLSRLVENHKKTFNMHMIKETDRKYDSLLESMEKEKKLDSEKVYKLLKKYHDQAHLGFGSLSRIMRDDNLEELEGNEDLLKKIIRNCEQCTKLNLQKTGFHPLKSYLAEQQLDILTLDLSFPPINSKEGHTCVLVCVDIATKFVWLVPLYDKTAKLIEFF
jgi:hypothetical protein